MTISFVNSDNKKSLLQKSIVVISENGEFAAQFADMLDGQDTFSATPQIGTLSGMNGAVVDLAKSNDLIIFETSKNQQYDVDSIENIQKNTDCRARVIALTDADISLADARRLTQAGVDEVITSPYDDADVQEQIKRLLSPNALVPYTEHSDGQNRAGKVIAVSKARGGAGATTLAVNIADQLLGRVGFAKKTAKKRVAIVDLDLQFGSIASFLDVEPKDALYRMAQSGTVPDQTFVQQSLVQAKSGISLLTAPQKFAPLDSLTPDQVRAILEELKKDFDYVVVELPAAIVDWVSPVLQAADRLLIATDTAVPSIAQARRMIDFFLEDAINLKIDMIVNGEAKPIFKGGAVKEAENVLERGLNHWIPSDPKAARGALDTGAPLSTVARRSPMTKALAKIARTIATELQTVDRPSANKAN